jgi:hypothetical protein
MLIQLNGMQWLTKGLTHFFLSLKKNVEMDHEGSNWNPQSNSIGS